MLIYIIHCASYLRVARETKGEQSVLGKFANGQVTSQISRNVDKGGKPSPTEHHY